MKILVTGVAGFVGSALARTLLDQGQSVVGIDSLTDYYSTDIKRANLATLANDNNFSFYEEDLNHAPLEDRLQDVSTVFHQAGQPGVRKSWGKDFTDYVDWNVLGTQRILEACKNMGHIERVVYASSSSIYGNAASYPTSEKDLPQPISPYGVTKLAAEHMMSLYAKNYGLPTVSLRYFTVYGPRQRPDMAFTRFVTAAQTDQTITIFGDGTQVRDFTYVGDVVQANISAAFGNTPEPGRVYNVAGGSSVSVNEILQTVEQIHGRPLNIQYVKKSLGDAVRTGGDTNAIQTELGWKAQTALRDGLNNQYHWASENLDILQNCITD